VFLVLALETTKDTLDDYLSGKYNEEGKDFSYPIKRLKMYIESGYENLLHTGKPTGGIFALKNFGWKDEQTQIIENKNKEISPADEEEILKKYNLKI
jgi:basic membrane lipoprotein Med (substrate-binding protein (PBP1-ABC) superfamily)